MDMSESCFNLLATGHSAAQWDQSFWKVSLEPETRCCIFLLVHNAEVSVSTATAFVNYCEKCLKLKHAQSAGKK